MKGSSTLSPPSASSRRPSTRTPAREGRATAPTGAAADSVFVRRQHQPVSFARGVLDLRRQVWGLTRWRWRRCPSRWAGCWWSPGWRRSPGCRPSDACLPR